MHLYIMFSLSRRLYHYSDNIHLNRYCAIHSLLSIWTSLCNIIGILYASQIKAARTRTIGGVSRTRKIGNSAGAEREDVLGDNRCSKCCVYKLETVFYLEGNYCQFGLF
ncbi:hypothetical protein XELAEV_18022078mg [Xenopus laevis]|uniref:Uncharacterized protein n=1 Tax=Xenopus laevis TaxID=8355 RepID=A0A974D1Q8_XENLA|nr:hypothetical protein XELAEV_18022078mg [Xenopus laevis]